MTRYRLAFITASCCIAGMALAQPSFDCAKAGSSAEEAICADTTLAALDQRLAERYQSALAAIAELDAGADQASDELRATQRGWIKGRDECWKAPDLNACVQDAYLTREAELVALWMLDPPTATVAYACGNTPANEVNVSFFATELPAVRVEYGDGVRAGWLVPAASGSKYALPFGGQFWSKSDEAQFEWTAGTPQTCKATN